MDKDRRYSLQEDSALAKAVQRYLPYLQALSQAAAPNMRPRTRPDTPAAQVTLVACSVGWGVSLTCRMQFSLCEHTGPTS